MDILLYTSVKIQNKPKHSRKYITKKKMLPIVFLYASSLLMKDVHRDMYTTALFAAELNRW